MKIAQIALYCLFILCVPVIFITGNIGLMVGEVRLYEYGFSKYHVSEITRIEHSELTRIASHLAGYFSLKSDIAQLEVARDGAKVDLFNERELVHLQDVRDLIRLNYRVWILSLALVFIYSLVFLFWLKGSWQVCVKGLLWGSVATLGLVLALAVGAVFDFGQFFLLFHLISFSNEYWILDPGKDYLIMLFPQGFFYDAAVFGFVAVSVEAVVIGGTAAGVLRSVNRTRNVQAVIS